MSAIDLDALDVQFTAFHARFAHHFYRSEYRQRSADASENIAEAKLMEILGI